MPFGSGTLDVTPTITYALRTGRSRFASAPKPEATSKTPIPSSPPDLTHRQRQGGQLLEGALGTYLPLKKQRLSGELTFSLTQNLQTPMPRS